ncbi:hypothetical protein BWQ96_00520 [Gracilariopsis chorda]|uniref:Uncharacterized protein n=1 Tax=Gracilariopsis chorda TaxID=448386 RepID=A0A2V3J691_9FLOR|nr:hypothetical protein BWQ96_00520 [Gracilariopsis chorda]|eukprot:PXF49642.1 hypothetical protein BWQ96_00520 [Gracilariopsis chorda]
MNAPSFLVALFIVTALITSSFAQPPRRIGRGSEFLSALPPPPARGPPAQAAQFSIVRRTPPPLPPSVPTVAMPAPTPVAVPDSVEPEVTEVPITPNVPPTRPPKRRRPRFFYWPPGFYRYRSTRAKRPYGGYL